MYPLISTPLGSVTVYTVSALIGFALAGLLVLLISRRFGVKRDDAVYIYVFASLGYGVGAKILALIFNLGDMFTDLFAIGSVDDAVDFYARYVASGFSVQGGVLGFLLVSCFMARFYGVDRGKTVPLMLPALCMINAFTRIGCFMNGCCYGISCEHGVVFPEGGAAPAGVPLLPTQLISSGINVLLVFVSLMIWKILARKGRAALSFPVFLIVFNICRFGMEFLRGDHGPGVTAVMVAAAAAPFISALWIALDIKKSSTYNL
ncbi:MAG: prolipoprotein diacylglyceryl transferase [Clostridiales bacterium]|nr:prolipoprotein diacylglyceryl transferase [Clostridiales bacterium]